MSDTLDGQDRAFIEPISLFDARGNEEGWRMPREDRQRRRAIAHMWLGGWPWPLILDIARHDRNRDAVLRFPPGVE